MPWIRPVGARALFAVALAMSPGCEEGGAAKAEGGGTAVTAGPAGEVVLVEGAVTAARPGEAPRVLELGSPVHADDTISVPMSAEVRILLAHNKVQWDIGSGQSYRVDQSRAWSAKAGSGSALDEQGELGTASAGRHGEREAGETQATTAQAEAAASADEEVARATPEPPPPDKPQRVRQRAAAEAAAPEAPRETMRGGAALGMRSKEMMDLPAGSGGGAQPAPESKSAASAASAAPRRDLAVALGDIKVKGARTPADVAGVLGGFSAAACGVSQTGAVVLRFEIGADGAVLKPRLTGPDALVAEVKSCVVAAARKLRFPAGASGNTFIEREIRFTAKTK